MHTKEEIKLNLLNFFSDRKNKTMINFLESYYKGKTSSYINIATPEHLFNSSNYRRFELKPYRIEDYGLVMELSILKNSDETFSHEVSFRSERRGEEDYSCELYPRVYIEKKLQNEIVIVNGKIVIQRYANDYRINPDYSIESEPKRVVLGIEVDIVNRQYNIIGEEANQCLNYELFTKKFMVNNVADYAWKSLLSKSVKEEINEEFKRNRAFKKAFIKYNLKNILDLKLEQLLVGMRFLVEMPNAEILFENNPITTSVLNEMTLFDPTGVMYSTSPTSILKNGNSITEILGFKKDYPQLVPILESIRYGSIVDFRDQLELLNQVIPLDDENDVLKYFELIKDNRLRFNPDLLYLGRRGYTINELYDYFKIVERKQAISKYDAIDYLYKVCNFYEIKNGRFKKLFPKSLKLMHDVFKRDINVKVETQKDQIIKNIINKREHLYMKTDEYEILPLFGEQLDKGMVIVNAFTGSEKVLYKSKNSTKYIEIRLYGESVRNISEKVSEKHLENIKTWAKLKNLYIESLDVKK